jgi:hypothetical protein
VNVDEVLVNLDLPPQPWAEGAVAQSGDDVRATLLLYDLGVFTAPRPESFLFAGHVQWRVRLVSPTCQHHAKEQAGQQSSHHGQ